MNSNEANAGCLNCCHSCSCTLCRLLRGALVQRWTEQVVDFEARVPARARLAPGVADAADDARRRLDDALGVWEEQGSLDSFRTVLRLLRVLFNTYMQHRPPTLGDPCITE